MHSGIKIKKKRGAEEKQGAKGFHTYTLVTSWKKPGGIE
jgi:hypothetical protein